MKASIVAPMASARAVFRALAWIWLAVVLVNFCWDTRHLRHANSDDVRFDTVVRDSGARLHAAELAREQGRFYMPIAFLPISALYQIADPLGFSAARTAVLAVQFGAAGWLFAALTRSRDVGLLLAVLAALLLQVPLCFNGVLSYPQAGLGFAATCVALRHCWVECSPRRSWVLPAIAFAACSMNEAFVAPLAIGVLVGRVWMHRWTPSHAMTSAGVLLYVSIYVTYRWTHASAYGGTTLSVGIDAIRSCFVQLMSTLPGFELLVNRYGFEPGPFFKSVPQIIAILGGLALEDIALLIAGVGIAAGLCHHSDAPPGGFSPRHAIGIAAVAVAFVATMSVTQKYQVWAYQRQYPYVYSLYSWLFMIGLLAILCSNLSRLKAQWQFAAPLLLATGALLTWTSNKHVFRSLERHPYPWPAHVIEALNPHVP